jgi:AraC family transcriptional regulator of adaptative response / DNA-3-methyladenine glycosylase II
LFPGPGELAGADLTGAGITCERAASIRALARSVLEKELTFESSSSLHDTISTLRAITGIAEATAHYIAMRAFGEPDAFPAGHLGIAFETDSRGDRVAEPWRPWRAYAAMHLWAADESPGRR